MNEILLKQTIESDLARFGDTPMRTAARQLFATLGYQSEKRFDLTPNTPQTFIAEFAQTRQLDANQALLDQWRNVDFLFQLTDDEVRQNEQLTLFESKGRWDNAIIESYLFFAIELSAAQYTRTQLASITRAVNRLFDMPVLLLFKHGETLTLAVINRRLHKRDESKDVLEKVTLIKDIRFAQPLRAHIEILADFTLNALKEEFGFHNFVTLQRAWEKRLATYQLTEQFYKEITNWYFWALQHPDVIPPRAVKTGEQRSIFLIRLLTRLIFCWFLQEKNLVPAVLFYRRTADELLQDASPTAGTYYRAILQNLFFATLNQEIEAREFRHSNPKGRAGDHGNTRRFRYADAFRDQERFLRLLDHVPFLNGGLFECLDLVYQKEENKPNIRLDDFSEEKDNQLHLPNDLFFGEERIVDLSTIYEDARYKKAKVRGLIEILSHYKFTIEENTPLEEEIALDPELLGKVFENLLASYNEETRTTARKATGSFYTPRQIVSYMVDEALLAHLRDALREDHNKGESIDEKDEERLRKLFGNMDADQVSTLFHEREIAALITAIDRVKILDPACGSGAFPMGTLHRLVDLLNKLDPNNRRWKERQRVRAQSDHLLAERMQDEVNREASLREIESRIEDIERSFNTSYHALDFARKLYLIENCIYGIDIQPIAVQIAKLRFFIALIVDQKTDPAATNLGVRPLPNLETKIVAANTLIPIEKSQANQLALLDVQIRPLREALAKVRHDHFNARTPQKKKRCREEDERLRRQLADLLHENGMPADAAQKLATWDPYDQNVAAEFFDPEWMFGLPVGKVRLDDDAPATLLGNFAFVNEASGQLQLAPPQEVESGFDIVLGNPPYVRIQTLKRENPQQVQFFKQYYQAARKGNYDLYVVFVEQSLRLLKATGHLAFILPHKFFNAQYGEPLRGLLADGRHLSQIVHFGDQQVFPGATNYVCLLFLNKTGVKNLRFVKVVDLYTWLATTEGEEAQIPTEGLTSSDWNFAVGKDIRVLNKLNLVPNKLEDVADLFVGLQTDADDVFLVEEISRSDRELVCYSSYTEQHHIFEAEHLKPLLKGSLNIRRYKLENVNKRLIFPYANVGNKSDLIASWEYARRYPHTWEYLQICQPRLTKRGSGKLGDNWYGYIYKKNHVKFDCPKLVVPSIALGSCFAADFEGKYYFVGSGGGGGGGYGIMLKDSTTISLSYLLGVLNSSIQTYYLQHTSTQFRGGYYALNRQYIEQLPIPLPKIEWRQVVANLSDYLTWLNSNASVANKLVENDPKDVTLNYFEQMINGLIYELFFAEELHTAGLYLFQLVQQANLPSLESIPEGKRLDELQQIFARLYDLNHSLRRALFDLRSLEFVRIIEGEA